MNENENVKVYNVETFSDERFGDIRLCRIDSHNVEGCGVDIAKALGYKNPIKALNDHCRWVTKRYVPHPQNPNKTIAMSFIPRGDIIRLIVRSKLALAQQFESWVFDEVIPTILDTGGYMVATPNMTDKEIMARAVMIGQKTIERISKENAVLKESKALLEAKVEADAPKVAFAEELEVSETCITIKQLSVLLYQNGYKTSEKRLFEELREDGFLCSKGEYKNEPAQHYLEMGLFKVKTSTFQYGSGGTGVGRKTLVTQKGVKYLLNYYLKKHGLLAETTTNNLLAAANDTQDTVMFSLVK